MQLTILGFWPDYDDSDTYYVVQVTNETKTLDKVEALNLRFVQNNDIIEIWIPASSFEKYTEDGTHLHL